MSRCRQDMSRRFGRSRPNACPKALRHLRPNTAEAARTGAEQLANLFRLRRARCSCANRIGELDLVQLMIAAKQCQDRTRFAVDRGDEHQRTLPAYPPPRLPETSSSLQSSARRASGILPARQVRLHPQSLADARLLSRHWPRIRNSSNSRLGLHRHLSWPRIRSILSHPSRPKMLLPSSRRLRKDCFRDPRRSQ